MTDSIEGLPSLFELTEAVRAERTQLSGTIVQAYVERRYEAYLHQGRAETLPPVVELPLGHALREQVVIVEGESLDGEAVIDWCADRLANFRVPEQVEFRDELPKSNVGKILRRALRDK